MRHVVLSAIASLILTGAATAQSAPAPVPADLAAYRALFDPAAVGAAPGSRLGIGWSMLYRGAMPHSAFGLLRNDAGDYKWTFAANRASAEAARAGVLESCATLAPQVPDARPCEILAIEGTMPGKPPFTPVQLEIGPFRTSPMHFRYGPQRAKGVVVFGHGYTFGSDSSNFPAQGWLSAFNDAGWDILRYDRKPDDDELDRSLARLVAGVPALRAAGYRQVILAGQSRGGWQALMAAAQVPVEGVIAIAPARHGQWRDAGNHLGAALDDWRSLLRSLPDQGPRVAVVLFDDDDYDPGPDRRTAMVAARAEKRAAPLVAFHPEAPFKGHGGANDWRFTRDWSPCLVTAFDGDEGWRGAKRAPCAPAMGADR